jgi:citrate synthase
VQIGKPGEATTTISTASAERIIVRDRDLAADLIGRLSFTEFFYFLTTGKEPDADQRALLDACLVAIAEHGLTPTNVAARMTLAADPACLQGAVAAGILGCGTVVLGTAAGAYRAIAEILNAAGLSGDVPTAARHYAEARRAARQPLPGFGHPLHKPVDPRAEKLIALAKQRHVASRAVLCAESLVALAAEIWQKPLPMNVSMAIAATLFDVGAPYAIVQGLPIVARAAGLIAHLAEETSNPIGFRMAAEAEASIRYAGAAPAASRV